MIGGETIEAVADRTGVNRESVRRYRNGAKPSAEFVVEVCRAYGLSSDWLLGLKKTRR